MKLKNGTLGVFLGNLIDGFDWILKAITVFDWVAISNAFLISISGAAGVFIFNYFAHKITQKK